MSELSKAKETALQRDPFFDNLRAILMFVVALCHGIENVRKYSPVIIIFHEILLCFVIRISPASGAALCASSTPACRSPKSVSLPSRGELPLGCSGWLDGTAAP